MSPKVVILGDFLRPSLDKTFNQALNLRWLYDVIAPDLLANGVQIINTDEALLNVRYDDLYESLYHNLTEFDLLDRWAQYYETLPASPFFERLAEQLQNHIIIIFEPSRGIRKFLAEHQLAYTEIGLHPLRFADDLLLSVQSSSGEIANRLMKFNKDRTWQRNCWLAKANEPTTRNDVPQFCQAHIIFLAQTSYDSSIIFEGSFLKLVEHQKSIRYIASNRAPYLKSHPLDPQSHSAMAWQTLFPDSVPVNQNFYDLIRRNEILDFITISSGSGYEAELAGHNVLYLSPWARNLDNAVWASTCPLGPDIWRPGFWTHVLTGLADPPEGVSLIEPDKLRSLIGQRWSKQ